MNRVFVFNPENDLALAAGSPHFTPPAAALHLASAGALLPLWYAGYGDFVLARDADISWIDKVGGMFGFGACVVSDVPVDAVDFRPWGWSGYIRRKLMLSGAPDCCLPDDERLEYIRKYSHRYTSVLMHRAVSRLTLPYPLPPEPLMVRDVAVIVDLIERGVCLFVKSPLSGSGRGILDSCSAPLRQIVRLASGVIKRQGAVLVERRLNKISDFAMLYDYYGGHARFVGYSSFFNAGYSTYSGNMLMSDEMLRSHIVSSGIPAEWLDVTRDAVSCALESVFGDRYDGPLGVDMMVYDRNGTPCIAPCVEVNVRMTMGRVAHTLASRDIAPGLKGVLRIVHNPSGVLSDACDVVGNRLVGGSVFLTPPDNNDFAFLMEIPK